MPPRKRSHRRSSSGRSNPLGQPLEALQRNFKQALQANRRQQALRQQRKQHSSSHSATEKDLLALRKALQFPWLQRRLQRRARQPQQSSWNPATWIWPHLGDSLSSREASALVMRHAATALTVLVLIMLVLNAVPVQLISPSWYLQLLVYLSENVPVLIVAAVLALLSLAQSSHEAAAGHYRKRLLLLTRLGYVLALLLVPLQFGLTAWLVGQTYSSNRTQLNAIRANADALVAGARQAATSEQFVAYLRSRNLTGNLESIAAAPLVQVQTEFVDSVKAQQQQQEQSLAATLRSTLLRYATNAIKLLANLLILAAFLRGFQSLLRRCSIQRPSGEQLSSESEQPRFIDAPQADPAN